MSKTRNLETLVKYILKHGTVYFSGSPRITTAEWELLDRSGYQMQREHGLHESPCAYPLHWEEFQRKAAREFRLQVEDVVSSSSK